MNSIESKITQTPPQLSKTNNKKCFTSLISMILAFCATFVVAVILGTGLLFLVYQLPIEPIQESAVQSVPLLEEEGLYPKLRNSNNSTRDNFTDALMLNTASLNTDKSLQDALNVGRVSGSAPSTQIDFLRAAAEGQTDSIVGYPRYWSGYLIILKPLLFLGLDYSAIRIFNGVVQIALLVCNIVLMFKRRISILIPALLATLMCTMSFLAPLSLQFSNVLTITLIANIVVLALQLKLNANWKLVVCFSLFGLATSYFDLLTYPLLTLGIPAVTWLFLSRQENEKSLFIHLLVSVIAWFAGYGCMWIAKWAIASVVLGQNIFGNALEQASYRVSFNSGSITSEETFGYYQLARRLLSHFAALPFLLPILCVLIPIGIDIFRRWKYASKRRNNDSGTWFILLSYFLIFCLPFIWFLVFSNHSYIHSWMAYKTIGVAVYALLVGLAWCAYCKPQSNSEIAYIPQNKHRVVTLKETSSN